MELAPVIAIALLAATVLLSVLTIDAIPSPTRDQARAMHDDHH